jgi:zinc protease
VKQQQILELPGSHETMNSIGGTLGDLLQLGLPLNFYDTYVRRVLDLSVADVNASANELLNPGQMTWMVVGDREKLESALRDLNIGEIIALKA